MIGSRRRQARRLQYADAWMRSLDAQFPEVDRNGPWRQSLFGLRQRYWDDTDDPIVVPPGEWFEIVKWLNDQLTGPAYDEFVRSLQYDGWPLLFGREVRCKGRE